MDHARPDVSSAPFSIRTMAGFLLAAGVSFAVTLIVGVADNPMGIGLLLLSIVLVVAAFVHHWRRPRPFVKMAIFSLAGIAVFAILHNVFYAFGELSRDLPVLPAIFDVLHVASFLIAIIVCPAGVVTGLLGAIITRLLGRGGRPS